MTDRRRFSQKKRKSIAARQGGRCAICRIPLQPAQFDIDHIAALVHDGDNEDDNLRALCFDCHKSKTRRDVAARARADAVAVGGKTRKGPPMPGSRASGWKMKMNGRAERRE